MQGSADDTHPQGRSQDGCKELCNVQLSIVEHVKQRTCLLNRVGVLSTSLNQRRWRLYKVWAPSKIIILDGAETLSRTKIFSQFGSGPNRILCTSDQQWRISVPSITRLDRAPTFYSNHVLWFTCSTNESWTLHLFFATVLTVWHFGSELKSSSGYNPPYRSMAVPAAKS